MDLINTASSLPGGDTAPLLSGRRDGWLRSVLEVTAAHPDPEARDARCKGERFLSLE